MTRLVRKNSIAEHRRTFEKASGVFQPVMRQHLTLGGEFLTGTKGQEADMLGEDIDNWADRRRCPGVPSKLASKAWSFHAVLPHEQSLKAPKTCQKPQFLLAQNGLRMKIRTEDRARTLLTEKSRMLAATFLTLCRIYSLLERSQIVSNLWDLL